MDEREEMAVLAEDLLELSALLDEEAAFLEAGEYEAAADLQSEKAALVPLVTRAVSLLQAVIQTEQIDSIEDDPDICDLAFSIIKVNQAAKANERALAASIEATQFVIRTMVSAIRQEQSPLPPLYTRDGVPVALNGQPMPVRIADHQF